MSTPAEVGAAALPLEQPVQPIRPIALTVLTWSAIGGAYGVALRAWMRLISTDPEFSWGGTGYIVGVFTILGTMAGLATAARHRHRGRSLLLVRIIGIVLSLGCFVAAGAAMLPTIVPAALGRARTDWPRPLRIALVLIGAAVAVAISLFSTLTDLSSGRLALGLVLYLALCCVEVEMTARLYAPSLPRGTLRRPWRIAVVVAVVALLIALVLLMVGLRA
jgi:hypothetical protein